MKDFRDKWDPWLAESELESSGDVTDVVDDVRAFFLNASHPIYLSKGTPSDISPDSVYHIAQLEVLFEDRHFHFRTYRAVKLLRDEGFLKETTIEVEGNPTIVVWRKGLRYTSRLIKEHVRIVGQYSSEAMNKATGSYAETLVHLGLSKLHFDLVERNSRTYRDRIWTKSNHDLDFIFEKDGAGFGVEVKNTWKYMPPDELSTKLELCDWLGLTPLFIVRARHSGQWDETLRHSGLLYMFKSKILPPGQENLAKEIWLKMRLPVARWDDWTGVFYRVIAGLPPRPPLGHSS